MAGRVPDAAHMATRSAARGLGAAGRRATPPVLHRPGGVGANGQVARWRAAPRSPAAGRRHRDRCLPGAGCPQGAAAPETRSHGPAVGQGEGAWCRQADGQGSRCGRGPSARPQAPRSRAGWRRRLRPYVEPWPRYRGLDGRRPCHQAPVLRRRTRRPWSATPTRCSLRGRCRRLPGPRRPHPPRRLRAHRQALPAGQAAAHRGQLGARSGRGRQGSSRSGQDWAGVPRFAAPAPAARQAGLAGCRLPAGVPRAAPGSLRHRPGSGPHGLGRGRAPPCRSVLPSVPPARRGPGGTPPFAMGRPRGPCRTRHGNGHGRGTIARLSAWPALPGRWRFPPRRGRRSRASPGRPAGSGPDDSAPPARHTAPQRPGPSPPAIPIAPHRDRSRPPWRSAPPVASGRASGLHRVQDSPRSARARGRMPPRSVGRAGHRAPVGMRPGQDPPPRPGRR